MQKKNNFPFTQIRVDKLKPADKTVVYSDTKQRNLKLSITPSGKSSYYARFKACGQSYNIRIGCVCVLTLDDARHRVVELMNHYRREAKQTSIRAVRMVLTSEHGHLSRWAALVSVSSRIDRTPDALRMGDNKMEEDLSKSRM